MNVKDFNKLQKKLEKAEKEYKQALETKDEELIKETYDNWHRIIQKNEGPGTGFFYDEDTNQFKIASDWHVDESGEIVRN